VAPLAPSRYRVQFTAGAELRDKIARAQALLRHQIPSGDLAEVFDRAVTLLLGHLERTRFAATAAPRKCVEEADPTPSSRHIPAPIRRGGVGAGWRAVHLSRRAGAALRRARAAGVPSRYPLRARR
jgi:hypothetical protein